MDRKFGETTVALATFPPRVERAISVLEKLWPQCDHLRACFNEFDTEPKSLIEFKNSIKSQITKNHTFEYILATGKDDFGCNNKMRWLDQCNGYYITVDDDIIYPSNYVDTMTQAIDRYDGRCVCAVHGNTFLPRIKDGPIVPDNTNKRIYFYGKGLTRDTQIHLAGMGTGACVPKQIGLTWSMFADKKNSGDDEKVAIYCQQNNIPIYAIARGQGFLKTNETKSYRLCTDSASRLRRIELLKSITWKEIIPPSIHVCYITDGNDENEKELAVSIVSLLKNSSLVPTIHIFATKTSSNFTKFIQHLNTIEYVNIEIKPISTDLITKCKQYNQPTIQMGKASATSIALVKFELPNLLPDNIDHVLYLDSDTLIVRDLGEIEDLIENKQSLPVLSAIGEKGTTKINYEKWPYHKHHDYFNSGVLLFNLNKMRQDKLSDALWLAKKDNLDQHLVDQNAFNIVFHDKVNLLSEKYNGVCYKEQSKDVRILHFCGHHKPLKFPKERYANLWLDIWDGVKKYFDGPVVQKVSKPTPKILDWDVDFGFDNPDKKVDFVWVLGSGSRNRDTELLFSIDSAIKFCQPWIRNIYIVGNNPQCNLKNYMWTHVPALDVFKNKDANIIHKTLTAIDKIPNLSDQFMLCSDDQLAIKQCSWSDFIPHRIQRFDPSDLAFYNICHKEVTKNDWLLNLYKTLSRFKGSPYPVYYYQPHIWSPIDKLSFSQMCKDLDWKTNLGNIIFSLYYNYIHFGTPIQCTNNIFFAKNQIGWPEIFNRMDAKIVAYNDNAFGSKAFRDELVKVLSKKSLN